MPPEPSTVTITQWWTAPDETYGVYVEVLTISDDVIASYGTPIPPGSTILTEVEFAEFFRELMVVGKAAWDAREAALVAAEEDALVEYETKVQALVDLGLVLPMAQSVAGAAPIVHDAVPYEPPGGSEWALRDGFYVSQSSIDYILAPIP